MNGLILIGIAIVVLVGAYIFYGGYLVKTWGIDPKAKTPAVELEDGENFEPTSKWVVFAHQFSSIAGAGPVTGPILAAMFGWLPAFLWILIGGVFFGAVQDFGALYASVKSKGKSMGGLIEEHIGKHGKKLFLCFSWLFTLLVIAAFSDMVVGTFDGFSKSGEPIYANASAGSISVLFMFVAVAFGVYIKKAKPSNRQQFIIGILLLIAMFAVGMKFPMYFDRNIWTLIVFVYIFAASILPMWILMQPRDFLNAFLMVGMILAAAVGVIVANPTIELPTFIGFEVDGKHIFPALFITVACGAVSGFHSLVSSNTSSKQITSEKDMLMTGYGSMLMESLLAVVALVVVGAASIGGQIPDATPFSIFSSGVAGFLGLLGIPSNISVVILTMFVSSLALTTLDSVARIGRMAFQELFEETDSLFSKIVHNKYVATVITLGAGYLLSRGGYQNIWPLFGAANQLLSALVLIALSVFMKATNRKGFMLWLPTIIMLIVTTTALSQAVYQIVMKLISGSSFLWLVDGLQLIFALSLLYLAIMVVLSASKKLKPEKVSVTRTQKM